MTQRVAIARTLANDSAVLAMDEPFGARDAETRRTVQELLVVIMESSRPTVLMVTHDIEEAIFLADRILFMTRHPGKIRKNLEIRFNSGGRIPDKEAVTGLEGYADLERHITHMMREESPSQERRA